MEKIFAEIRDSVEKEAAQLINRAKRVAEREIKYAKVEAENILSEQDAEMHKQAGRLEEREKSHNSIDERKVELDQIQTFVDKVFKLALEKIREIPRDEKYESWINHLFTIGLRNFKDKNVVVFSSKTDSELVKKIAIANNVDFSDEAIDIDGGIVIKNRDGRLSVNLSAEAELNNAKDDLRNGVLLRLTK